MRRTRGNSPSLATLHALSRLRQVAMTLAWSAALGVGLACAGAERSHAAIAIAVANPDVWSAPLVRNADFTGGDHSVSAAAQARREAAGKGEDRAANWADSGVVESVRYLRDDLTSKVAGYQAWFNSWALMATRQNWHDEGSDGAAIVGAASWYSPLQPDSDSEANETATSSGEQYDPDSYTAAIRIDLRDQFGGVRFGSNYRPAYALIECAGKQLIARINDVGPLKPGRIIDLNERTMRFFDESLQLGIVEGVKVTPLPGQYWIAGPVSDEVSVREAALETWDVGLAKSGNLAVASNAAAVVVEEQTEAADAIAPSPRRIYAIAWADNAAAEARLSGDPCEAQSRAEARWPLGFGDPASVRQASIDIDAPASVGPATTESADVVRQPDPNRRPRTAFRAARLKAVEPSRDGIAFPLLAFHVQRDLAALVDDSDGGFFHSAGASRSAPAPMSQTRARDGPGWQGRASGELLQRAAAESAPGNLRIDPGGSGGRSRLQGFV